MVSLSTSTSITPATGCVDSTKFTFSGTFAEITGSAIPSAEIRLEILYNDPVLGWILEPEWYFYYRETDISFSANQVRKSPTYTFTPTKVGEYMVAAEAFNNADPADFTTSTTFFEVTEGPCGIQIDPLVIAGIVAVILVGGALIYVSTRRG